jgi:hypothetical protein
VQPSIALVAAAAALVAAAATAEPVPPAAPSAVAQDPTLAYYPPAALAAGVGGTATVVCKGPEGAPYKNCRVKQEAPAGYGFGSAASDLMESAYAQCTKRWDGPDERSFTFGTPLLFIQPDLLARDGPIANPHWLDLPTAYEFALVYPEDAALRGLGGDTIQDCAVGADGRLTDCRLIEELPVGQHFGEAARKLAARFRMALTSCSGDPVAGRRISVPIRSVPARR